MRFLGSTNPQSNAGLVSGLRVAMETNTMARTAPQNGHYFLGKGKFRINAGDPLPDGAEFAHNTEPDRLRSDAVVATHDGLSEEQYAAMREHFFAEFNAELLDSAIEFGGTEETFDFDVSGAYDRYIADERANGPDDQLAFQDAVLGVFGITFDACADCDCDDGECTKQEAEPVQDDELKPEQAQAVEEPATEPDPEPKARAKKAAPENKAKTAPENR